MNLPTRRFARRALAASLAVVSLLLRPELRFDAKARASAAGAAGLPDLPHGVSSLTKAGAAVPQAILSNPDVALVSLRSDWASVEPREGQYDWSYFDGQVARAAEAGKPVILRVISGASKVPSWVNDKATQKIAFVDSNSHHSSFKQSLTMPVFWDPALVQAKKALLGAMGARFGTNKAILVVGVACANARTDDWNVPHRPEDIQNWRGAGYTPDKLVEACKETVDAAMTAFPRSYVLMAFNNGISLDPSPDYVARSTIQYGNEKYPGRLIPQRNNLAANTPDPARGESPPKIWYTLLQQSSPVAAQMLWFVTKDPTCRMNGGRQPCDPTEVLNATVTTAAHYGVHYLEVYEVDVLNPTLAPVIKYAATALGKAHVPLPPPRAGGAGHRQKQGHAQPDDEELEPDFES